MPPCPARSVPPAVGSRTADNFFTEGTVDEQFEKVKRKKEALYNQTIRRIEDTISFTALQVWETV
eukprot:5788169-Prymnesium_polylepis.2